MVLGKLCALLLLYSYMELLYGGESIVTSQNIYMGLPSKPHFI